MSDATPEPASRVVSRRTLHRGRKFDLEMVSVAERSGNVAEREVVRHPGAVVIVPLLPGGRVALIQNYRPSVGRFLLELPAGTLEQGEEPFLCARRELIEETGFEAENLEPLGRFYTSPGLSDELMFAFVARGLRQVGQRLEEGEEIRVAPVPVQEALRMARGGELMDGKSILALLLADDQGMLGERGDVGPRGG